jgi:molecular chaperone DnaK
VVLVGGSTRMPLIRHRLARYLGLDAGRIRSDLDPEELVARGAGLVARDLPPPAAIEFGPINLRSANLRLRSEMAAPGTELPADVGAEPGSLGALPRPPAETPADFRPAAQQTYDRLTSASPDDLPALRRAYLAFIAAIRSAEPDTHLHRLGSALTAELASTEPTRSTPCPVRTRNPEPPAD